MNVRKRRHVGDGDSDVDSLDEEEEEAGISFPLFKGQFSSWEEFHKKFDSYQADTHQLYKLRTTNSVKDRNKQRTAQAIRRGTTPLLFDESLQYYTKSLICTHGWSFKPRGKGDRTNHNIRSIECPAKLNAVLFQDKSGCYKVRVSSHLAVHNHDVGQDVYYSYAEARKINSPGTRNVVKTLVQGGSKKKKILRYLKDVSGKPILPKDVENLIARMRRETYTSEDDNKRVTQLLHDFSEGPGNAVNVFRDKGTGLTSCITFQTAHMRRMTRKFPEAICIDATYGTNINRYRLFSFMVTDKFGCGAFAQHALVDGESRANMACAVSAFKQNNPAWSEVKVIVIDKDFTELALLEDEFPAATVILCHFHVIDYLKRQVSKKDYGFSSFEKMHIKNLLTMMVRAENEVSFDDYLSAVKKLCASKPAFIDYFTENWLNCKDLWCTFKRGNIPHLDNNTNNRLEASWGATKQVLHRHMAMDECIDHLLFLQQSAEDQYAAKVKRVGFRYNQHYDEEMCMLAKLATHHACDLVEEQYCVSSEETYRIAADTVSPTYINISSEKSGSDFAVSVEENKCSCAFYQTLLLPCRHILFLRRQKGLRSVIPYESIPERWLLADEDEGEDVPDVAQRFFVEDIETAPDRVLGHNEKYRAGFAICQKIAEVVADKGSRSFRAWISYLTKVERAARLDDAPPSDKLGDAFTNTSELGDTLTSSSDVGKEVGEVSEEVGEEVGDAFTNLSGMDDGVGVEDTTGDVVDITSLGSPVHIAQLASTPVQRRLDLNTVDSDDTLTIQLNTASRPAGRPREKKSAKKAKRSKEFEGTKACKPA